MKKAIALIASVLLLAALRRPARTAKKMWNCYKL